MIADTPRRIIFSRKGFDSAAGGCPSPVIEGRPVSLPIPNGRYPGGCAYRQLAAPRPELVRDLTRGRIDGDALCHLDPDIDRGAVARGTAWQAAFGQVGAAQGHLRRQGVGVGDLFLFFGLFRAAVRAGGGWSWTGTPFHALFGWLRVGEVVTGAEAAERPELQDHPHAAPDWPADSRIYVAADRLGLARAPALAGAGVFARAHRLSADSARASDWAVPAWLERGRMSYRGADRWWTAPGRMNAHGQWQEAVAPGCAEAADWAAGVIAAHGAPA